MGQSRIRFCIAVLYIFDWSTICFESGVKSYQILYSGAIHFSLVNHMKIRQSRIRFCIAVLYIFHSSITTKSYFSPVSPVSSLTDLPLRKTIEHYANEEGRSEHDL